jgi:DNA-binding MarR family transcriptional regulator
MAGRMAYLLKRAFITLEELHDEYLTPLGLNARELALLLFLDGREPESQRQAALRLGVDRTTMVGLLDTLEHKDLVIRRPHTEDRRRNVVDLTPAGRATLKRAIRASDRAEQQLLAGLDDLEAAQLRSLLGRVASSAAGTPDAEQPASDEVPKTAPR